MFHAGQTGAHDVLKGLHSDFNKADYKGTGAGIKEIAGALSVKLAQTGLAHQSAKEGKQTAIEFISHVMGTMNENMSQEFQQTQFDGGNGFEIRSNSEFIPKLVKNNKGPKQ